MSGQGRFYRPAPPAMLDCAAAVELERAGAWSTTCPAHPECQPVQGGPDGLQAHLSTVHPDWTTGPS